MLYHHSNGPYEVAAAAARTRALDKLQEMIERGRANGAAVIEQVFSQVPEDRLPKGSALEFAPSAGSGLAVRIGADAGPVHRHALGQLAYRGSIPMAYVDHLRHPDNGTWGPELLAHNLNEVYHQRFPEQRFLTRSVGGQLRGFLSDRYRRLDVRPLLESFVIAIREAGASIYDGYALDTKVALKAILPNVYEPVPNEVVGFGVAFENSDFGDGALQLSMFSWRAWCTNTAILNDELRRVHLGKRLDEAMVYSQKTYELDQQTMASALNDTLQHVLNQARIEAYCGAVREAAEEQVDPRKVRDLLKKRLAKDEVDQVVDAYNSPDVIELPAGNTAWRLSNAVSLVARDLNDRHRALELMKFAGTLVPGAGDEQSAAEPVSATWKQDWARDEAAAVAV